MKSIPHDKNPDSSLALLRDGFRFIQNRSERYQSDIFMTSLAGQKVVCLHGEEAAKVFYDSEKFKRKGVIPQRIQKTMFGKGGVQALDGANHKQRKEMFMSFMGPESIQELLEFMADQWKASVRKWEREKKPVVLFDEVPEILCRAVCAWAGVPLKESEARKRAKDFIAMVDAFGAIGPRHWRGKAARARGGKWMKGIIEQIRKRELVPKGTPAYQIAMHQELNGSQMDTQTAAVELINVIRPTVAISWYITFSALALHEHPEYRQRLREGDEKLCEMFVQEVRRMYPFAPFLGAKVSREFDWQGHHFKKGRLVLLDMYGTLHDAKLWKNPDEFRPERFKDWKGSPFDFIPQGGGDHYTGHRCAGEWITIEVTKLSLQFLVNFMEYTVPEQDLSFSLARIPTYPKSGFIMENVRGAGLLASDKGSKHGRALAPDRAPSFAGEGCPFHQKKENSSPQNRGPK